MLVSVVLDDCPEGRCRERRGRHGGVAPLFSCQQIPRIHVTLRSYFDQCFDINGFPFI